MTSVYGLAVIDEEQTVMLLSSETACDGSERCGVDEDFVDVTIMTSVYGLAVIDEEQTVIPNSFDSRIKLPKTVSDDQNRFPKSNTLMRSHFARTRQIPTAAQIRENLGSLIADALFSSIPPELRESIGLEPKLKGPTEASMWSSPSDQLVGKLKLTVVPSERHAHAITHNAILEIGGEIEEMVAKMNERELQQKLQEQERMFDQILEERVQGIRNKVMREFFELSSLKLRELFNQMEADFKEEWKKREVALLTEAEHERIEGIRHLEEAMKCELDNVTRLHEDKYSSQLKFLVDWEKAQAHDEYHQKTMQLQRKWAKLFRDAKESAKVTSRSQMAQLRACHEAEIWSAITREREYADQVLYEVVKFNKNQLLTLDEEIIKLRDKFAEACADRDRFKEDIEAWKCVLRDLFNQFQKFINFVLQEIPGQAEYLLSLSEIMKSRKECLPRVRKDISAHKYMSEQKRKEEESWEEILVRPIDQLKDPTLFEWKSKIDLDDEDDDRRRKKDAKTEEEYLKELAEGKKQEECVQMIKNVSNWVLNKIEGIQVTPPVSSLSSSSSESVESKKASVDPEILKYVEQMEKNLPMPPDERKTQKEELEAEVAKVSASFRGSVHVSGADLEVPDPCPAPFVAKRINSILNILDAHPYLRKVLNES